MFLSIDIGATKTLLALFSFHGLCLKRRRFPTSQDAKNFLSDLQHNLELLIDSSRLRHRILALTVAIPGKIIVHQNSYSFHCPNLSWAKLDLFNPLKNLFSCPIFFVNDANLATLYETSRLPAARQLQKVIYLTFSTGIGGGISEYGSLLARSDAFEPGHKLYPNPDASSPAQLEWEDIASAKALSERYHAKLTDLQLTPDVRADLLARLCLGLKDLILTEAPQIIIIGGPLGLIFKRLKRPLLDLLRSMLSDPSTSFSSSNPNSNPNLNSEFTSINSPALPVFLSAKRPTESVIYGAYLYSKSHYSAQS